MVDRIKLNRAGIRAVLSSSEVRSAIGSLSKAMAERARGLTDDEIVVKMHQRRDRVGAYIIRTESGARGEAHDRALGRSIGGG